jgi:DNA modification methylase
MENIKILNGNNIDLLKQYPDNYFDAVVTDPLVGMEMNAEYCKIAEARIIGYQDEKLHTHKEINEDDNDNQLKLF